MLLRCDTYTTGSASSFRVEPPRGALVAQELWVAIVTVLELAGRIVSGETMSCPGRQATRARTAPNSSPIYVLQVEACEHGKVDVKKVFGPEARGVVAHMNSEAQHRGAVAAAKNAAANKHGEVSRANSPTTDRSVRMGRIRASRCYGLHVPKVGGANGGNASIDVLNTSDCANQKCNEKSRTHCEGEMISGMIQTRPAFPN